MERNLAKKFRVLGTVKAEYMHEKNSLLFESRFSTVHYFKTIRLKHNEIEIVSNLNTDLKFYFIMRIFSLEFISAIFTFWAAEESGQFDG